MNVYSLTEHDHNVSDWKNNVDSAIVPCLNKFITNNSFKVSRWLIQSILANVDLIKFAFVTRKNMENATQHQVLATHTVRANIWFKQLNMQMDQMWNKIKYLVDSIEEDQEDPEESAEYIMLKDFNKLAFRLYKKDDEEEADEEEEQEKE